METEKTQAQETRDIIQDNSTIISLDADELKVAEKVAKENDADVKQALNAVRQLRENRAAESKFKASYSETKTVEAIMNEVKDYRKQKATTAEKLDMIRNNDQWSDGYKNELANEQQAALRDRTAASREATLKLLDDITADRMAYDKAFFSDPERLENANKVITVLKNAGKNMSISDFANLTEPLFGDAAANRYIWSAIKDDPMPLKRVIEKMAVDTQTAFNDSRKAIDAYFRGQFDTDSHGVLQTIINDAAKIGIALTVTDFNEPIYSDRRVKALEADFSEDEAAELIRKSMRGY